MHAIVLDPSKDVFTLVTETSIKELSTGFLFHLLGQYGITNDQSQFKCLKVNQPEHPEPKGHIFLDTNLTGEMVKKEFESRGWEIINKTH